MNPLIIGRGINLGTMLGYFGVNSTTQDGITPDGKPHDLSIIYGAWSSRRVLGSIALLPGFKVFRIQGTDAYRMTKSTRRALELALRMGSILLYAGENLRDLVKLSGRVWVTPVDTRLFHPVEGVERDIDVLYYCTPGKEDVYCLNRFMEYIEQTRESYTILDGSQPIEDMPKIYSQHRKYIRFTTHDAHAKMPYEAYLCGCESYDNERRITALPDYLSMENAIPELLHILKEEWIID